MAATSGTPVVKNYTSPVTSVAIALSGVQSGQPILFMVSCLNGSSLPSGNPTDNFSTSYTWSSLGAVSDSTMGECMQVWIGTGGSGSSGTVTSPTLSSGDWGGIAIPLVNASTASGTSAVDAYSFTDNTTSSTSCATASETASAVEELAVAFVTTYYHITANPSGWTSTALDLSTTQYGGCATLANPSTSSGTEATWTQSTAQHSLTGIVIMKEALTTGSCSLSLTASATGSLVLAGTGSATIDCELSATGSLVLAGTGSSALVLTASASGSLNFAGTGTSAVVLTASGAAGLSFSPSATASSSLVASAAATLDYATSATSGLVLLGAGNATLLLTDSASGAVVLNSASSGVLELTSAGAALLEVLLAGAASFLPSGPPQTYAFDLDRPRSAWTTDRANSAWAVECLSSLWTDGQPGSAWAVQAGARSAWRVGP